MISLVTSEGKRLLRTASGRLTESSGQLLLEFDSPAREAAVVGINSAAEKPPYDELVERALAYEATAPQKAAELYQRMLVRWPDDAQLWFNLGNALYASEQLPAAAAAFRVAAARDPDWPEAWNNLGATLLDLGEWQAAEWALQQALRLMPGYEHALANLADLAAERNTREHSVDGT